MKFNVKTGSSDLKSSNVVTSAYKIQQNSKMFDILSSKLYTDKILAPIRELLCNAFDAHVAAGIPEHPIRVTLGAVFSVRDFGKGLNIQDMEELYTTYGASSKADSNDFIGCLGLGSKSPFAYTDMFTVVSRHKGMKHQFVCSMSDSVPAIHRFESVMLQEDEGTGLEVSFQIKPGNCREFENKLVKFSKTFCAPIVIEQEGHTWSPEREALDFGKYGVTTHREQTEWGNRRVGVLMGGVCYNYSIPDFSDSLPLTREQYDRVSDAVRNNDNNIFLVEAKLGDVDIAASREQCEQRPRTANFVLTKLYNYVNGIEEDFLKALDEANPHMKLIPRLSAWAVFVNKHPFITKFRIDRELNMAASQGRLMCPYTDAERKALHATLGSELSAVTHIARTWSGKSRKRKILDMMPDFFEECAPGSSLRNGQDISKLIALTDGSIMFLKFPEKKKKNLPMAVHDMYTEVKDFFLFSDQRVADRLTEIGVEWLTVDQLNLPKPERAKSTVITADGKRAARPKAEGVFGVLANWSMGASDQDISSYDLLRRSENIELSSVDTVSSEYKASDEIWKDTSKFILIPMSSSSVNRVTIASDFLAAVWSNVKPVIRGSLRPRMLITWLMSKGYTVFYRRFMPNNLMTNLAKEVKRIGAPDPVEVVSNSLKAIWKMPLDVLERDYLAVVGIASFGGDCGDRRDRLSKCLPMALELLDDEDRELYTRLYGGIDKLKFDSDSWGKRKLNAVAYILRSALDGHQHYCQYSAPNSLQLILNGEDIYERFKGIRGDYQTLNDSGLWIMRSMASSIYAGFLESLWRSVNQHDEKFTARLLRASLLLRDAEAADKKVSKKSKNTLA